MKPEERLMLRNKVSIRHRVPASNPVLADGLNDKIGYLLNQCANAIRLETAKALEKYSINPREAGVLVCLLENAPIVQQDLAELARIDRTTTMNIVTKLVDDGLIERKLHPMDRRAWVLSLTEKGKKTAVSVAGMVDRVQDDFLSKLSQSQQDCLKSALCALLAEPPS